MKKDDSMSEWAENWSLNSEEQKILEAFEAGDYELAPNHQQRTQEAVDAAKAFSRKNARLNIRISDDDLLRLKLKASKEGLPYQTLAASVIHKFVYGDL